LPVSAPEWDYVVPFGPVSVAFSGKCFPIQPLKVDDSTSIEILNLLSIFIGVTMEFYWVSYISKYSSYCHYIEKEKNLDVYVCVCGHVRAHTDVPLDLSANCYESYDYKLCFTKTITSNIVNFQRCTSSKNCCVTKQHMRKICP